MATIAENLQKVRNVKSALMTSINAKNKGAITNSTPFSAYPSAIDAIEVGGSTTGGGSSDFSNYTIQEQLTIAEYTDTDYNPLKAVKKVYIPENITSVGSFSGCSNLEEVIIDSNALCVFTDNSNFAGCTKLVKASLEGAESLSENIFSDCTSLRDVTLPSILNDIPTGAFKGCSSLESINLPSVTGLSSSSFYECEKLSAITLPSSLGSIGNNCFYNCIGLRSISIPKRVSSIGTSAFYRCSSLSAVTFNTSLLTSFPPNCFFGCSSLSAIAIPDSVKLIDNSCFEYCSGLTEVNINDYVTSIGSFCFYQCSGLTEVTIGNSVTSIGDYCFYQCTSLTSVTCKATTPPTLGSSTFSSTPSNLVIYVPSESVDAYKSATNWSKYADKIQAITS